MWLTSSTWRSIVSGPTPSNSTQPPREAARSCSSQIAFVLGMHPDPRRGIDPLGPQNFHLLHRRHAVAGVAGDRQSALKMHSRCRLDQLPIDVGEPAAIDADLDKARPNPRLLDAFLPFREPSLGELVCRFRQARAWAGTCPGERRSTLCSSECASHSPETAA